MKEKDRLKELATVEMGMGCKKCARLLDEKVHLGVIEWWSVLLYLHVSVCLFLG